MTDIPDEVKTAGRRVYDKLGRGSVADSEIIMRALLARDKRAAEIARNASKFHLDAAKMGLPISPSPIIAKDRARIAQQIAASILTYEQPDEKEPK